MQNPRLATRYAKSILDLAIEQNQLEAVYGDMKHIIGICKTNPDFVAMLKSPIIKGDKKDKMINDAKEQAKVAASKIVADAQASINQQKMAAITDLKNQVGKLVIEVSEKVLRRELNNKPDQETFIKQLAEEAKLN